VPAVPAPAAPKPPAVPAPAAPKPPAAEAAPPARAPSADRASSSRSGAGGGFVDFGALLQDSSDAEQGLTRYVVDAPTPSGDEDRDFLDMLEQFKSKVSEHLGDDDAQSRYDLGLAFKEMGLYDEAISQFQMALRGLEDQLKVYEELGDCFMQKGEHTIALKILQGALAVASSSGGGELIGVYYQLGRTYEELGRAAEARDAYERVLVFDLEFRDASSRLARL
jgi:tetratricopeptide (TPR) repeat protein